VLGAGSGILVLESAISAGNACEPRCAPDQIGSVKLRAGIGYGLMGAGFIAATTGVVLMLLGRSDDPPAGLGWFAPAESGVIVGGRF
jgi:hypothetical protein